MRTRSYAPLPAVLSCACFVDAGPPANNLTDSDATSVETSGPNALSTTTTSGTTDDESTEQLDESTETVTSTTGPSPTDESTGATPTTGAAPPYCGDGNIDDGEECDNGELDNHDNASCTSECAVATCGDGLVLMNPDNPDDEEECDNGGENDDGGVCTTGCEFRALAVFVTSEQFPGDLAQFDPDQVTPSGIAGADAICRELAEDAGLYNHDAFLAWISGGGESPATRFIKPTQGVNRPYALLNGQTVAETWEDLVSDTPLGVNINITERWLIENGGPAGYVMDGMPWSATRTDGTPVPGVGIDCDDWTSADENDGAWVGDTLKTDEGWTKSNLVSCLFPRRLYCFEQPVTNG